jgi:hypothetical protein
MRAVSKQAVRPSWVTRPREPALVSGTSRATGRFGLVADKALIRVVATCGEDAYSGPMREGPGQRRMTPRPWSSPS